MATKTYKSFRYKAKTTWSSARRGTLSAVGKPNVVVGSPPEFKGEADNWSPEELFVGSLNTCIMLTFFALAQARGLTPVAYESESEGPARKCRRQVSHHGGDGSASSRCRDRRPTRARAQDHGSCRGAVLRLELDYFPRDGRSGVCRRTGGKARTFWGRLLTAV